MPIVDIEVVSIGEGAELGAPATKLANSLGAVFGSQPGHVWVRLRALSASAYAENDTTLSPTELPVFVTVLHAHLPEEEAMVEQIAQVTQSVAACLGLSPERVHVQYAPKAAGRQAFGGALVR